MLRLLLAMAVVSWHTGFVLGLPMIAGGIAVETFFVISGFYMALVLNTKYTGAGSYRLFLTNRALRLYPGYWAAMVATVALCLFFQWVQGVSRLSIYQNHLTPGAFTYLVMTQLVIVGQDATMFLGRAADGSFYLATDFWASPEPRPFSFLLVGQAWSLSVELMFYAVAPFLVRRAPRVVAGWIAASLALRMVMHFGLRLDHDPWLTGFFPTELALFLAGALAYRMVEPLRAAAPPSWLLAAVSLGFLALTLAFPALPDIPVRGGVFIRNYLYFSVTAVSIPFLFLWTGRSHLDRAVGELSYPVYVLHSVVMIVFEGMPVWLLAFLKDLSIYSIVVFVVSCVASVAMIRWLVDPLERYRQARVARSTETDHATSPVPEGALHAAAGG